MLGGQFLSLTRPSCPQSYAFDKRDFCWLQGYRVWAQGFEDALNPEPMAPIPTNCEVVVTICSCILEETIAAEVEHHAPSFSGLANGLKSPKAYQARQVHAASPRAA